LRGETKKYQIKSLGYLLEVVLLVLVFALSHGNPPPDVNEAHYLVKAKHYWDPGFCPTDFFLSSADAHLCFYWMFGWLTLLFELPVVAWLGRVVSWILIGSALVTLGRKVSKGFLPGVFVGSVFVILTENFHLAGEWVIGGFEAKTIAYGLAFWGANRALESKWSQTWLLVGTASAVHVLAGGWIVLGLLIYRVVTLVRTNKKPARGEVMCLIVGGCLSLGGLVPGLLLSSSDPTVAAEANYLYVHVRLPHHLVVTTFSTERILMFLVMLVGLGFGWRLSSQWRQPSHKLVVYPAVVSLLFAVVGVLITFGLGDDSPLQHRLLRFYFYRTSDVLVPLASSVMACVVVYGVCRESGSGVRLSGSILLLVVGLYLADALGDRYWDPRPRSDVLTLPKSKKKDPLARKENTLRIHRHWQLACLWMKNHSSEDSIAITPLRQQTFKWYAGRGEVVTRKDMPQDAKSLMEWNERRNAVYPFVDGSRSLSRVGNDLLAANCERYDADYLVLTQFSDETRHRFDKDTRFRKMFPPPGKFSYYGVFQFVGKQ
jgi:hypothetical protein